MMIDERRNAENLDARNKELLGQIVQIVTEKVTEVVKPLLDEVNTLKTHIAKLEDILTQHRQSNSLALDSKVSNAQTPTRSLAEVVKSSVLESRRHEETKAQVVIVNAKEEGKDEALITDLCKKVNHNANPKDTVRIGRKSAEGTECL